MDIFNVQNSKRDIQRTNICYKEINITDDFDGRWLVRGVWSPVWICINAIYQRKIKTVIYNYYPIKGFLVQWARMYTHLANVSTLKYFDMYRYVSNLIYFLRSV